MKRKKPTPKPDAGKKKSRKTLDKPKKSVYNIREGYRQTVRPQNLVKKNDRIRGWGRSFLFAIAKCQDECSKTDQQPCKLQPIPK